MASMKWLIVDELADILSVPRSRVYYWTHTDEIPHYKLGQSVRFRLDEIMDWMETKRCN